MTFLNNYLNMSHYLILSYMIYQTNKKNKILLFVLSIVFGVFESYINSISSDLSSTMFAVTYTTIFIKIFNKNRIDVVLSMSVIYVTITQCITFVVVMIIRLIFNNNMMIFDHQLYSLLIALLISFITYFLFVYGKVNINKLKTINKLIIPFIVIHMITGFAGQSIMYNEDIEYKLIMLTIFAALVVVYYFFIQSNYLQKIINRMMKEEDIYQKEISFLKEIIESYQNDKNQLHDMYSLLLKEQGTNAEISEFLKNHQPTMRILTCDENYNFVINMLINISEFKEVQIESLITHFVEIEKIDLLVLFHELFKLYTEEYIQVYSNNGLQIKMKISKGVDISERLKDVIILYNGIYTISDESLIIRLFYC